MAVDMTKKEAREILTEMVADYVTNGYPMEYLVGDDQRYATSSTRPDPHWLRKLADALYVLDRHTEATILYDQLAQE